MQLKGEYELSIPAVTKKEIENLIQKTALNSKIASIKAIGDVESVIFSEAVAAQGLTLVNVRAIHSEGITEWRVDISPSGGVVNLVLNGTQELQKEERLKTLSIDSYYFNNSIILGQVPIFTAGQSPEFGGNAIAGRAQNGLAVQLQKDELAKKASILPPPVDSRVVEFLISTTRMYIPNSKKNLATYSSERSSLSFAICSVRIPEDHKIGRIELPGSWSLFGITLSTAPNDREHFIIKSILPVKEGVFGEIVKSQNSRTALIFIHGYNTTFEDSILRNAQIVWDLQYKGVSILFSWPSRGGVGDYLYDKDSTSSSRSALLNLIAKLRRDYGIEQINIIAHSMGNLLALEALAGYSQTNNPVQIAQLIMAAPDVDRDTFLDLAPKAKSIIDGMTLYASAADKALALSKQMAGGVPRAGDVPVTGPIVIPEVMETLDVTAVGEEIFGLNHDVFSASRDVMEDISALLRFNRKSPRLSQIRAVPEPPSPVHYWRYVR